MFDYILRKRLQKLFINNFIYRHLSKLNSVNDDGPFLSGYSKLLFWVGNNLNFYFSFAIHQQKSASIESILFPEIVSSKDIIV